MSDPTFFDSLKAYVGFTDESSAILRRLHPLVSGSFPAIIDDFYATIEAHPEASAAITGGGEQIARLKSTLLRWLDELLLGPHDADYFDRRARIGRVHVRINLPQAFMLTAMDRIRVQTLEVVETALAGDLEALRRASRALHQIMDIDLAIMLETYREDLLIKNRTAERLSTIGQFAAGIGHELRNPLGVIESSQFLLRQHLKDVVAQDPAVKRHLDKIVTEVQRSNKTISDLLELARERPVQRRPVRVGALVAAARSAATLPPGVDLELRVPEDLDAAVDVDQMGRVLSNLFTNASQAMGGRGTIVVEAWREAGGTRLRVRDTGPGVPADVRHRIFEALFTTKAKGSGLGLALARRIAEAHGGTLALEPTSGGASFLVAVPDLPGRGTS